MLHSYHPLGQTLLQHFLPQTPQFLHMLRCGGVGDPWTSPLRGVHGKDVQEYFIWEGDERRCHPLEIIPSFSAITSLQLLQSGRAVWHNWVLMAARLPGTDNSLPPAKKHTPKREQ